MTNCTLCGRSSEEVRFHKDRASPSGLHRHCKPCREIRRKVRLALLTHEQNRARLDKAAENMRAFRATPAGQIAQERDRALCRLRGRKREFERHRRDRALKKMQNDQPLTELDQEQILKLIAKDKGKRKP